MEEKKEKVSNRYDLWTPFYDVIDNFPLLSGFQNRWKKNAVDRLDPGDGERILDVGTGTGEILPWIVKRMDEGLVVGTDISEGMLEKARTRIGNIDDISDDLEVKIVKDDIESSRFPDDYFDKIIATFTFTTVPHVEKAASECARILKLKGDMVILDTGRPKSRLWYPLFYPMMISAKLFGRTHIDRDVERVVSRSFEINKSEDNMMGMVYTLECKVD